MDLRQHLQYGLGCDNSIIDFLKTAMLDTTSEMERLSDYGLDYVYPKLPFRAKAHSSSVAGLLIALAFRQVYEHLRLYENEGQQIDPTFVTKEHMRNQLRELHRQGTRSKLEDMIAETLREHFSINRENSVASSNRSRASKISSKSKQILRPLK